MKKLYKNKESLAKIIILLTLLVYPFPSFAELLSEKWTTDCNKETKVCNIGINSQYDIQNSDKKGTLATITIRMGSTTKKKMNLVNAEENTYKLSEENQLVPVIFINLPLNVDLKKNPLVKIDDKDIFNMTYTHCNKKIGCATSLRLNDDVIKLFKEGKEIKVILAAYGNNKNMSITFPLKGFTKSYKKMLK